MNIWMITGLHNSRWVSNTITNFVRQQYLYKRLIVVENGEGIGAWPQHTGLSPIVLRSEPGAAQSLNTALSWLREHVGAEGWFCKCDSDDYYSANYLSSIVPAIEAGADYAGRSSLYIRTTEERLWYVEGDPHAHVFHGPTIAGRVSSSYDFPLVQDWGEDAEWCLQMHASGRTCKVLPPEGVCYQRWAGYRHTWPCTDREILTSWDRPFCDLGDFDIDVIDGTKPRPKGHLLDSKPTGINDLMAIRVLKERLQGCSFLGSTLFSAKVEG